MKRKIEAYVVPFVVFMLFLPVPDVVAPFLKSVSPILGENPKFVVWPLQTLVCAGLLMWYWKEYNWGGSTKWVWGIGIGVLSIAIWLAPEFVVPGSKPRVDGFNPTLLEETPILWWLTVIARFLRLVVIVPLVEEIFWRGFLMRYLINPEFEKVRLGTYSHMAFWAVVVLFMLAHGVADWPAAFVVGALFNFVAIRTRSLSTCVITHAVTNLLLGIYIMFTGKWGYW